MAAALLALTACTSQQEEIDKHHFDNKLYVNFTSAKDEILVKPTAESAHITRTLSVSTALKADTKITAKFVADASLLDEYKKAYLDETAVALPEGICTIEGAEVSIEPGSNASSNVTVVFEGADQLDRETIYVQPVALRNVSGIEVLDSKTVVYYVFKGAALINVVADMAENRAYPDFNNDPKFNGLTQFTMECLVNFNKFGRTISSIMGIEGNFLLRAGDAGVPDNQLQVASSRNLTNSDLQFETGKWYHVAMVFDGGNVTVYFNGKEKLTGNCGKSSVSLGAKHTDTEASGRCFWIGYSYANDRYMDGKISEARIWNRCLSADEINSANHFYSVDPASDGLIAYWKFDEGAGSTIKDYASGFNLTVDKVPGWNKVSLP